MGGAKRRWAAQRKKMAAVAAEPGAAAALTTTIAATDDGGPPESGPAGTGRPAVPAGAFSPRESGPAAELEDGGDAEARHVRPELEPAAGSAPLDGTGTEEQVPVLPGDCVSPVLPGDPEGGGNVSVQEAYRSIPQDPQPSAVFLHSFPAPPPVTEAGLSLDEPAEPTTNVTTDRDRGYTARVQAELRPAEDGVSDGSADRLSAPDGPDSDQAYGHNSEPTSDCRSPKTRLAGEDPPSGPDPVSSPLQDLSLGSEVRVSLDHVIDDALVVSFRLGDRIFSGVLMDVSKRFGPYGIPITVFPRRDDESRPAVSLPPVTDNSPSVKEEEVTVSPSPPPHPWTTKPPPLFQEGAPYPPPLFIRDTYNQALPQPPTRKIRRPKRRYRCEEPTSIMNAIRLRPRQVLCDKCKGVVAPSGHREARRGAVDLRGEEASRRRRPPEGPISSEVKRLRCDDKGGRPATDRRLSPSSSSPSSRRVLRRGASPAPSSAPSGHMRLKLNSQKVLTKGSAVDRSKARQVQTQRRSKDQNQSQIQDRTKAVTRAAALQNHNQKVHFTRRLQHLSGAPAGSTSTSTATLPPRMRLKPQRYRTDDNQAPSSSSSSSSSSPKQTTRSSPPKVTLSPAPITDPASPTPPPLSPVPPSSCVVSVSMEVFKPCPPEEVEMVEKGGGGGEDGQVEPPPPSCSSSSSSSLDSSHSECSSTENFDPPPAVPPFSPPPSTIPPPPSLLVPLCPTSSSPDKQRADSEETSAGGEEEEEGDDLKRRRKSSTSSTSSSSSSSSSVFSKSVSKCPLPDGRTVCVGDIVWAKIYGFPWWPARVLGIMVFRRGDTGLAVRQEARVSWFGSPTTSFLPLAQLSPFLETFQSRFDRKRKGPYRRAIAEAASAAKQLTPEVRALLTQFET